MCINGVLKPRHRDIQPPLPVMIQHVMKGEAGDEALISWAVKQRSRAVSNNEVILGQKAGCLKLAYLSIGTQVTLLAAMIIISF